MPRSRRPLLAEVRGVIGEIAGWPPVAAAWKEWESSEAELWDVTPGRWSGRYIQLMRRGDVV